MSFPRFLLCAALISSVCALSWAGDEFKPTDPTQVELMQLKAAYEKAVNENNLDAFLPYLDKDFTGTVLFQQIRGADGMRALWDRVARDIGQGKDAHRLRVKLKPEHVDVHGDVADVSGTTEETVMTPVGELHYSSNWKAHMTKQGGHWKMTTMESMIDPGGSIGNMVMLVAQQIWRRPSVQGHFDGDNDPNYDGFRADLKR